MEKNRNATVRESYRVSIQLDSGALRAYEAGAPRGSGFFACGNSVQYATSRGEQLNAEKSGA